VETPEDVETVFSYIESSDLLGLGMTVRALRAYAQKEGRKLSGIEDGSVFQLHPNKGTATEISLDSGFFNRSAFARRVLIAVGMPIEALIHELVHFVPTDALPDAYRGYARSIPIVDPQTPFEQLYQTLLERMVKEEALAVFISSQFEVALGERGYYIMQGADKAELASIHAILESGIEAVEDRIRKLEPRRTKEQVRAFQRAVELNKGAKTFWDTVEGDLIVEEREGAEVHYRLNDDRFRQLIGDYAKSLAGETMISLTLKLTPLLPPRLIPIAIRWSIGNRIDTEEFFDLKEELITQLVRLLGEHITVPQPISTSIATGPELGQRVLPTKLGDPARIEKEPEASRHLLTIFGTYMRYAEHADRFDPKFKTCRPAQLFALARFLDPSRDRLWINRILAYWKDLYDGRTTFVEILFETGFNDKARELVRSMDSYQWTTPLLKCLAKRGEKDLLAPHINEHRKTMTPNSYDPSRFEPLSLDLADGLPEISAALYKEEWDHIKDNLRIYLLGKPHVHYDNDVSDWWQSNQKNITLADHPFDPFSVDNLQIVQGNTSGNLYSLMRDFLVRGLETPCLFSRALAAVRELSDSPMKLHLFGVAAQHLPHDWDLRDIREFYDEWHALACKMGEELAKREYVEPSLNQRRWAEPSNKKQDEWAREQIEKNKRLHPPSYHYTRLFHENLRRMLESLDKLIESKGSGTPEATSLIQRGNEFLDEAKGQAAPVFDALRGYEDGNWREHPLYFSGSSYAALHSWWQQRRGQTVDKLAFRRLVSMVTFPRPKDFSYELWQIHPEGHDQLAVYVACLQSFLIDATQLYRYGLSLGLESEAGSFYNQVREDLVELAKDPWRLQETDVQEAQSYWAIQTDVQHLLTRTEETEQRTLDMQRKLREDVRGFFKPEQIAQAARDLSQAPACRTAAISLFRESIDRMTKSRGEKKNGNVVFSKSVYTSLRESELSSAQKDELYLYMSQQMWPKGAYPITRFIRPHEGNGSAAFVNDILDQRDQFSKTVVYMLERIAEKAQEMDPNKHGDSLGDDFKFEVEALSQVAGRFADRKELGDPANFAALQHLFPDKETALSILEPLFPGKVQEARQQGQTRSLPRPNDVESGKVTASELENILPPVLAKGPAGVGYQQACEVARAWLRRDLIALINRREKEQEDSQKHLADKSPIVYEQADLQPLAAFALLWPYAEPLLTKTELLEGEMSLMQALLVSKSDREVSAKAWLYYRILKGPRTCVEAQRIAFEELCRSPHFIPGYVKKVYDERIRGKDLRHEKAFFADVALWDHRPIYRPTTLWAHLLEETDQDARARLRASISRYLAYPESWEPNLFHKEDWAVWAQKFMSHTYGISAEGHFRNVLASLAQQRFLKGASLEERILFLLERRRGMDQVLCRLFIRNWNRLDDVSFQEFLKAYDEEPETLFNQLTADERIDRLHTEFENEKSRFLKMKKGAGYVTKTEFGQVSWEMETAYELLLLIPKVGANRSVSLRELLLARFPELNEDQVDRLCNVAANPYLIEEDTEGKSSEWWPKGAHNYQYSGEQAWMDTIFSVCKFTPKSQEGQDLVAFLYPFSKTFYYRHFDSLGDFSKCAEPEASLLEYEKPSFTAANALARAMAPLTARELDHLAQELPSIARLQLARGHQMSLASIEIPAALSAHAPLALFLFKTYFNLLDIGPKEELAEALKDQDEGEALHRFFVTRHLEKVGQFLADRPEVPERYRSRLRRLRDQVAPSNETEVRNTIERELGWRAQDYSLDRVLNAGSMGEVWLAHHKDYQFPLAIKVLTDSKLARINHVIGELERLKEAVSWYEDILEEAPIAIQLVGQLVDLLRSEINFQNDYTNWLEMTGYTDKKPSLEEVHEDGTIPLPGTPFWTPYYVEAKPRVLVMSYVAGVNPLDPELGLTDWNQRKDLAYGLWDLLYDRAMTHASGLYPMDLHLGNVLTIPASNKAVILDTGQMGRMDAHSQLKMNTFAKDVILYFSGAFGISFGSMNSVVESLEALSDDSRSYNRQGLRKHLEELKKQAGMNPLEIFRNIFVNAPRYGLEIQRPYRDLLKGLMTFQGTARDLWPDFTLQEALTRRRPAQTPAARSA